MQLIKLKINPKSSFGSFPKGDMVFGHFANHLFSYENNNLLENYLSEKPKIIFSDFLPDGYFPKPSLPLDSFGVEDTEKKEFRKKAWIKIDDIQKTNQKENYESLEFYKTSEVVRNSINRLTFSTDDSGVFAPYSIEELRFLYQPVLYVMFDDESFKQDDIIKILNKIGKSGFGAKSSTGKGQFEVSLDSDFKNFKDIESKYYLTLSPTILNSSKDIIENAYYNTFNRFGKFFNTNAPFKKPLLMADSSAVIEAKDNNKLQYIGRAIENGYENSESFVQGYSILVPFKFDGKGVVENGSK